MIYDCFMFFNELDLIETRFKILDPHVTKFVVVEADTTHSGLGKPYLFEQNYTRFSPWLDKICYVKMRDLPISPNRWLAENAQRNGILTGIDPNAWILIGDADEIPNLETWDGQEGVFQQIHSYYKINKVVSRLWNGTVVVHGSKFFSQYGKILPQDCRNFRDILKPVGGGWHFSWLTDVQEKLKAFAHSELEDSGWTQSDELSPGENLPLIYVDLNSIPYPYEIITNRDKYQKWIAQ